MVLATPFRAPTASDSVLRRGDFIAPVLHEIHRVIVGQDYLVNRLLMGMLCNGHLLVEGVPGLAKSLAVKTLADTVDADFKRIQFTPDLLPAELNGTMIYNPSTQSFSPRLGPIFTDLLLADEINRAPPKVQSALLEAMQERQVSIGGQTHPLADLFTVLATQNPIEHTRSLMAGTTSFPTTSRRSRWTSCGTGSSSRTRRRRRRSHPRWSSVASSTT